MKELSWEDLAGADANSSPIPGAGTEPKRRGRRPKGTTVDVALTKSAIIEALSLANFPIQLTGYGRYALSADEINAMADAWFKVIKQNPYIAKYLVQAGKVGVWGNLLLVHAKIIGARVEMYQAEQAEKKRASGAGTPKATPTVVAPKPNGDDVMSRMLS